MENNRTIEGVVVQHLACGGVGTDLSGTAAERLVAEVVEDAVGVVDGSLEVLDPPADGGVGAALGVGVQQDVLDGREVPLQLRTGLVQAPRAQKLAHQRVADLGGDAAHQRYQQRTHVGRSPPVSWLGRRNGRTNMKSWLFVTRTLRRNALKQGPCILRFLGHADPLLQMRLE